MKFFETLIKNIKKKNITREQVFLFALLLVAIVWFSLFDFQITPSATTARLFGGSTETPQPVTAETLSEKVVPVQGYTVNINWGETGKKLVEAGGIDMAKYRENYSDPKNVELLTYLTDEKKDGITITRENAYFWVNTLWALGLTQKSDVLDKGVMGTEYADRVGNFASTGGWTLGAKDAVSLYSSSEIIPLTQEQQDLVAKVSSNIYRPCCGNPTSFPDCNHGMAILGLLELMAAQGATEEEMYETSLAFNSYWFSTTYVDLAYYFQTEQGLEWKEVDPKLALSADFSSAQGYGAIKQQIGNIPGSKNVGASCGT